MISYALLDQAEEDALHRSRLLNVEEKPFRRITKRLLTPSTSLIHAPPTHLPTPPPDASSADEAAAAVATSRQQQGAERAQWREDVQLDFAAFESSVARIQFVRSSNARDRERYAAEKEEIEAAARAVRDDTARLRLQLDAARTTLALRKTYDDLADKITSNRLLRPREDQAANLQKLNAEIAELERESTDYARTWAERREQFGRIVEEGMLLRRLIRDEKEEVERREGMEEEAEEGEVGSLRGRGSGAATPRAEGGGGVTPMHAGQESDGSTPGGGLNVDRQGRVRSRSRLGESRSPRGEMDASHASEGDDANMMEEGETTANGEDEAVDREMHEAGEVGEAAPPEGVVAKSDEEEKEEGEEDEDSPRPTGEEGGEGEIMDTR